VTEELYSTDAYARSTNASVVELHADGVVLDRTVFYARSGGQPGDTGRLRWDGGEARVTDTFKKDGRHLHVVEGDSPPAGVAVKAEVEW